MELLGDVGHVELVLICFETMFALVQDRCLLCVKRTIGS
jgi:hypothetical protein